MARRRGKNLSWGCAPYTTTSAPGGTRYGSVVRSDHLADEAALEHALVGAQVRERHLEVRVVVSHAEQPEPLAPRRGREEAGREAGRRDELRVLTDPQVGDHEGVRDGVGHLQTQQLEGGPRPQDVEVARSESGHRCGEELEPDQVVVHVCRFFPCLFG